MRTLPAGMVPWKPGQSGNPKGRPKAVNDVALLARQHGPAAVEKLAELMHHSKDERVQVAAAKILLDRGYGAVKQIEDIPDRPMLTADERMAMLHEIARRLGLSLIPAIEGVSDVEVSHNSEDGHSERAPDKNDQV